MGALKKICIHWTAGTYDNLEQGHYHKTIGVNGSVYNGKKPPESNIPKDGKSLSNQDPSTYVPHCGGGNSFCIGVAFVGMAGFQGPTKWGKYPLTKTQCEAGFKEVARLCKQYGIPVTPGTVFTHYEFGLKNPNTPSRGKIDIMFLPPWPELKANEVGDFIRSKVSWYLQHV